MLLGAFSSFFSCFCLTTTAFRPIYSTVLCNLEITFIIRFFFFYIYTFVVTRPFGWSNLRPPAFYWLVFFFTFFFGGGGIIVIEFIPCWSFQFYKFLLASLRNDSLNFHIISLGVKQITGESTFAEFFFLLLLSAENTIIEKYLKNNIWALVSSFISCYCSCFYNSLLSWDWLLLSLFLVESSIFYKVLLD